MSSSSKPSPNAVLDESISEDLHAAVDRTFIQMFGLKTESKFATLDCESSLPGGVTGMMALNQNGPHGVLVLTFPHPTLFAIMKKFFKREFTEIDKVAMGTVGEITNIVFGVFKHRLREKGFNYPLGLPQVAMEGAQRIPDAKWILRGEINCAAGPFHIYVVRVID